VRVELVGIRNDNQPSIASVIAINISDEQPNKMAVDTHRFVAIPAEIADTKSYFIRVLIP
jgi:hypothetical protein